MIATMSDFYKDFIDKVIHKRNIILFTSRDCTFACAHCVQGQGIIKGKQDPHLMSKEIIDKVFNQLYDNNFSICVCGGEALLHLEQVDYVVKKANKRGMPTVVGTNGFFWDNKEILDALKYDIKPTYIRLSVDTFHQKFISLDKLEVLIHYFDDSPIKIFGGSILNYECSEQDKEKFDNLGLMYEVMSCVYAGNASLLQRKEKLSPGALVTCEACGIVIDPDGKLFIECEMEIDGCNIGNIYDENISSITLIFSGERKMNAKMLANCK
jgi:organic radical activating enzyme